MAQQVYVTRCVVKKNGTRYNKGAVIDGLTSDEIKKGLAEKWLVAIGGDEQPEKDESVKPKGGKKPKGEKKPPKTDREELAKKAAELGIDITDEMTADDIQQLITEKEAGAQ